MVYIEIDDRSAMAKKLIAFIEEMPFATVYKAPETVSGKETKSRMRDVKPSKTGGGNLAMDKLIQKKGNRDISGFKKAFGSEPDFPLNKR